MTGLTSETLKAIINLLDHGASKDPTRPIINSVQIKNLNNSFVLQATDGHILSQKTLSRDSFPCELKSALIGREMLGFLKHLKSLKKYNYSQEFKNDELYFEGTKVSNNANGFKFPNVESFIPSMQSRKFEIAFNPELLMRIAKAVGDNKHYKTHLLISDMRDPVIVKVTNTDTKEENYSVMMPLRVDPILKKESEEIHAKN